MKAIAPVQVRTWKENKERVEYAKRLGIELPTFVNELIRDYGKDYLEKWKAKQSKALEAPIP